VFSEHKHYDNAATNVSNENVGAEWRQVLRESVSSGAKKNESITGRVWVAGFHHVTAGSRLAGRRFEIYETSISLIFLWGGGGVGAAVNRGY
jgi:head-tail adaptor